MNSNHIRNIVEAALLAADQPLTVDKLLSLFEPDEAPTREQIRSALKCIEDESAQRCVELKQVASGFRLQVRSEYSPWVSRLWEEKPGRYSRALLETLALITYRQPITRAEIEDVRGVSVSTSIIKTLMERDWIAVVGHRNVPGKPALYGTTRQFLNDFNLRSLEQLPPLNDVARMEPLAEQLALLEQVQLTADTDSAVNPDSGRSVGQVVIDSDETDSHVPSDASIN